MVGITTRNRFLFAITMCVALVMLGAGALLWGNNHRYQAPNLQGVPAGSPQTASASTSRSAPDAGEPAHLDVPDAYIDADLIRIGLNSDGTLAVPSGRNVDRVAWYENSPRPGQAGPAVLEGHVITPHGDGPFRHLDRLRPGNRLTIKDRSGVARRFVVYRTARYPKDAFPTDQVYGNTAGAEVRLITCSGVFDPRSGHYDSNTVVYAR